MTSPRPTATEAGLLVHALCERVAKDAGVRMLAIKGPAVAIQGLRPPRASADVDVLVHADDLDRLVDNMVTAGWHKAVEPTHPGVIRTHSTNLLHEHWPVGVHVHNHFPGFLAPDRKVFEALWVRRTSLSLAGVPVTVLDPVSQVAVVGLHLLREDPDGVGSGVQDLTSRALARLQPSELDDLLLLAVATDCVVPLRPVLVRLGLGHAVSFETAHP